MLLLLQIILHDVAPNRLQLFLRCRCVLVARLHDELVLCRQRGSGCQRLGDFSLSRVYQLTFCHGLKGGRQRVLPWWVRHGDPWGQHVINRGCKLCLRGKPVSFYT